MSTKRRKVVSEMLRTYENLYSTEQQPIKSEPRDRTPPHHNISSPPLHAFAPQYEQNWGLENMQPGLGGRGPSHVNPAVTGHGNPFAQEIWQNQSYGQVSPGHLQPSAMPQTVPGLPPNMGQAMSPHMQPMSPNMQPMSPNMQPLSPNMQQTYAAERMSPNMNVLSPHAQSMSPNMGVLSPHAQSLSPNLGVLSPALGRVSPNMPQNLGHMSPNMPQNMGHISPNLVQHQQPTYAQQQQAQQNLMDQEGNSAASLTHLLLDRGDSSLQLNSSELSGLSALLGERGQEPQPLDY